MSEIIGGYMEKKISRRDLLKALIAGSGGIVAAGFVPEKWLKPVVKSGVLPVHAQASAPDHNYVRGWGQFYDYYEGFSLIASAYVSSVDFTFPIVKNINNFKVASPIKVELPRIDFPVGGEGVTLYIDGIKHSTKPTDLEGFVEWSIEDSYPTPIPTPLPTPMPCTMKLKFEIFGHYDEVVLTASQFA